MKLRLQDDSLRLRLSRDDLRRLAVAGVVEGAVHVGPGSSLVYRLQAADTLHLGAEVEANTVTVRVPHAWLVGWADDERVGFDGTQDAGDGRTLTVLVEKDFDCLHRPPESGGTFPRPDA